MLARRGRFDFPAKADAILSRSFAALAKTTAGSVKDVSGIEFSPLSLGESSGIEMTSMASCFLATAWSFVDTVLTDRARLSGGAETSEGFGLFIVSTWAGASSRDVCLGLGFVVCVGTGRSLRVGSLSIIGFSSTKSFRSTSSRGRYCIDLGLGLDSAGCSRIVCLDNDFASISGVGSSIRSAPIRGACLNEVGLGRGCAGAACSRGNCFDADGLASASASGLVFRLLVLLIAAGGAVDPFIGSTFSCRCCRGGG